MSDLGDNPNFPEISPDFYQTRVLTTERNFDFVDVEGLIIAIPISVRYPGNNLAAAKSLVIVEREQLTINFNGKTVKTTWSDVLVQLGLA